GVGLGVARHVGEQAAPVSRLTPPSRSSSPPRWPNGDPSTPDAPEPWGGAAGGGRARLEGLLAPPRQAQYAKRGVKGDSEAARFYRPYLGFTRRTMAKFLHQGDDVSFAPRVLLVTGTCGSGKSTVASLLAGCGWASISEDEIWPRLFGKNRGAFGSPE